MRPLQVFALFGAIFFAPQVFAGLCPSGGNFVITLSVLGAPGSTAYNNWLNAVGTTSFQVTQADLGQTSPITSLLTNAIVALFPNLTSGGISYGTNGKTYINSGAGLYSPLTFSSSDCAAPPDNSQECSDKAGSTYMGAKGSGAGCAPDGCAYVAISTSNGSISLGGHQVYDSGSTIYQATGETCQGYDGTLGDIGPAPDSQNGCVQISDSSMVCDSSAGIEGMPDGCMAVIRDSTTTFTCSSDNPESGSSESVCGFVGDTYTCVNKGVCEYVNGSTVCVDESGEYVGTDSPDNPQNGGNLDGDVTNDVMAPGSMPDSPVTSTSQVAANKQSASEIASALKPSLDAIAGKIDGTNARLDGVNSTLDDIYSTLNNGPSGSNLPNSNDYTQDSAVTGFFSDLEEAIGNAEQPGQYGSSMMGDAGNGLLAAAGIPISNNCEDLEFPIYKDWGVSFSCSLMSKSQSILAWVFWIYTVYSVISIAFSTVSNRES